MAYWVESQGPRLLGLFQGSNQDRPIENSSFTELKYLFSIQSKRAT